MLLTLLSLVAFQDAAPANPAPVKPKKICRTIETTGSRLASRKICRTEEEWREDAQRTERDVERLQSAPSTAR